MSEDTSCDQIPDPRNSLCVLRGLDFQSDTEDLGEIASVGETTRLAHCQATRQLLSFFKGDDLLVELVHDLLMTQDSPVCAFDTQAEKSALEDSNVSICQMTLPCGM